MTGREGADREEGETATTFDAFLGGRFHLFQPLKGFRSGADALVLASVVPQTCTGLAVDLGCGPGAVGFAVAARAPGMQVALVDWAADQVALVARSLGHPANAALAPRLSAIEGDVLEPPRVWRPALEAGSADVVLLNPPWFGPGAHRPAPAEARRRARSRSNDDASLQDWFRAARRLTGPRGRVAVVVPSAALGDVIAGLSRGFGGVIVHPLWPRAGMPAGRVVVTARRDSRAPLAIAPGLRLHEDGPAGRATPEAEAILRHGAALPGAWGA